jgi:hypothetical protein
MTAEFLELDFDDITIEEEPGPIPREEMPDEDTKECFSLRDVLLRAKDERHINDLIQYLVLDRLDPR